ncbi:Fe-S cluster assembly protein SufD [Lysobacteraceae bacterium NML08-0793]|nr:Fe-S cluster assembly protein SufD [Xanthomonadaceae bacterium NML08-0793]
MSALLDSLLAGNDSAQAQAILAAGLPGARSEAWKYTSLRALERRSFAPAAPASADATQLAHIPAPRIVFVNGRLDQTLSQLAALPPEIRLDFDAPAQTAPKPQEEPANAWQSASDHWFVRVNQLLASGVNIHVNGEAGTLHLVCLHRNGAQDQAVHLRHRIALAPASRLTLVEHHLGDAAHNGLATGHVEITLDADAQLQHLRLQNDSLGAQHFLRSDARLGDRSHYQRLDLELGAALSRHELQVHLHGEGAHLYAAGVLLGDGRRHLDTRLGIHHHAGNTRSVLPWRGLATGRARVVFHGGIQIHAGADGTEADLQNRNILLSAQAEIDTQPVLVIDADEVKAAHGATVGQLDANALFYLRSRGIPEAEAQRILTAAFCRDLLGQIEDPALHGLLEAQLDAALDRMNHP